MTLYEVDLDVKYRRKVLIEKPDEDAACDQAVEDEEHRIEQMGPVQVYGVREVKKAEVED